MRVAECAVGKPAADRDHGHRQAMVVDIVADLLGAAEGREIGDRIGEDVVAFRGHAGGEPRHVLLGDARIDEAIGEAFGEGLDHGIAEIAYDQRDMIMPFGEVGELMNEGVAHEDGLGPGGFQLR